jgi:hypothetical protein
MHSHNYYIHVNGVTKWGYGATATPLFIPLASFLVSSPSISFYLLGIPPLAWCDPVHLGPRLLVNWPPHSLPHSLPTPNSQHPRLIVCSTKTTSRLRLHRVRNTNKSTESNKHWIKQKSNNETGNKQKNHWSEECHSKEVELWPQYLLGL